MTPIVLLADRPPRSALPALLELHEDLKIQPLAVVSLTHVLELEPELVLVDAGEDPAKAWSVLQELQAQDPRLPTVVIIELGQVERYPWHEIADEFVHSSEQTASLGLRLAMLRRRTTVEPGAQIRLGALALDTDSYRVTASGRALDLTFKEFELLRFLASHPGRVFTRPTLLREVWGYDFYGGTRTVDVHVRRLRAKLGPEYEQLIETVRSVGYRAADID
jgi:DNA-binding response OmpR family regulator